MNYINENINSINALLPKNVKLIAVSKTHGAEVVLKAYEAGQRVFGENKVQELVPKYEALPKDIEWHLIGHLQKNKVKYIAPFVSLIHSVDSIELLEEINKQAVKCSKVVSCLFQIHIAQEETKFGLNEEELMSLINNGDIEKLKNIKILGLMGMATNTTDSTLISKEFEYINSLFNKLKNYNLPPNMNMTELSIGMSSDFKIAVEHGATMVRVGSLIFGNR